MEVRKTKPENEKKKISNPPINFIDDSKIDETLDKLKHQTSKKMSDMWKPTHSATPENKASAPSHPNPKRLFSCRRFRLSN